MSGIDSSYEIPDELSNQIFPLLVNKPKRKKNTGRPRLDDRKAMNAIFYIALLDVSGSTTTKSWCIRSYK